MGSLKQSNCRPEINREAALVAAKVAAVISSVDSDVRIPRRKALVQHLYELCLSEISEAKALKAPEHSCDAGILKIGRCCVKFHLNSWKNTRHNYKEQKTVDFLNSSGIVAPVLAREFPDCSVDSNPYAVVAYQYIEGRSLADLFGRSSEARESNFSTEQMGAFWQLTKWHAAQAEKLNLVLTALPRDYIIEPSGKVTLTDWNQIAFKDLGAS